MTVSLKLFYRWGKLPMLKFYIGVGRVGYIMPQDILDYNRDRKGNYYCIVCGAPLRPIHWARRYYCSNDCERKMNSHIASFGSWQSFRKQVKERDGNKCAVCKCDLSASNYVCDHIIPLFRGGRDWWEDPLMTNFQTLCMDCNRKKTALDLAVPKKPLDVALHNRFVVNIGGVIWEPVDYRLDRFLEVKVDV